MKPPLEIFVCTNSDVVIKGITEPRPLFITEHREEAAKEAVAKAVSVLEEQLVFEHVKIKLQYEWPVIEDPWNPSDDRFYAWPADGFAVRKSQLTDEIRRAICMAKQAVFEILTAWEKKEGGFDRLPQFLKELL